MKRIAPLFVFALAGCTAEAQQPPAQPLTPQLSVVRVIDGDTLVVDGETVRIANIDTAEMPPRSKCLAEQRLAVAAKVGLEDVLEIGWGVSVTLDRQGRDQYGRTVAKVRLLDGTDVGDEMVKRGLAEPWIGRRMDWCV